MKTDPSASNPPKFQRPNPEGAKSKSKIVRANGKLARLVSQIHKAGNCIDRVITTTGEILDVPSYLVTPDKSAAGESNFNAAYQRHLRKLDADKIKHPKK